MGEALVKKINRYYDECHIYYKIFWGSGKNLSFHYGFHDNGQGHGEGLVRMIEVLADKARISSREKVLDAGCGVGGSSIWLAQNIGCTVSGIDINHKFVETARKEAEKRNLDSLVSFHEMNFCKTAFKENTFDIAWALESSCYAEDKRAFLEEMSRVLKPGGRIVIADAYNTRDTPELGIDLSGWVVPNIPGVTEFTEYLTRAGFRHVACEDISSQVMPSSLRIYRIAVVVYPFIRLLKLLRIKTDLSVNHARLSLKQYGYATEGPVKYCIFVAEKA